MGILSKDKDKTRRDRWGFQDTSHTLKRSHLLVILKEDCHSKGIRYKIKRIVTGIFPWLGKEMSMQRQEAFRTPDNTRKEHPLTISHEVC